MIGPFSFSASCGGTLIDRKNILTAASCIQKTVTYNGSVFTNSYYPTIESQYTVYLGLQNKSFIQDTGDISPPAVKMFVSAVTVV